ncbi:Putative ABC1 protein At2g40090 [Linum perenne]
MAARFLWRTQAKLVVASTALVSGGAAAAIATSDDPATALKVCTTVPLRLVRDSVTAASIAFDYEYSLVGLPEGSEERVKVKHEVHLRSARKLQELFFRNGGIYIKLGQHIGQLIFSEFDPVPIASASLAQVHVARTSDGQKVAVKVQHTHMTDTAAADHATVDMIVNALHWVFPSFDYRWLVDEMSESLPKARTLLSFLFLDFSLLEQELDFLIEAKNSERCLENFWRFSPHIAASVYAPKVYWNLSTSKVLTMEYMDGAHVNDIKTIQKLGLQPKEVATLVSQAFAEMMFKHGFVHCDPHAANLIIRPLPSSRRNILGKRKPQLVLLDHGLYKELDFSTRFNYASLWKALIFADAKSIKENCVKLGAGEDLYPLFAGILTMKPWNRVIDPAVDHLVIRGNTSELSELQMYASQYFPQISELLRRLPRVILLLLKTNDCLRAVNNSLLQGSSLESFFIVGKVSSEAVIEAKKSQRKSILAWLDIWLDQLRLEVRLLGMKVALWLFQMRRALSG